MYLACKVRIDVENAQFNSATFDADTGMCMEVAFDGKSTIVGNIEENTFSYKLGTALTGSERIEFEKEFWAQNGMLKVIVRVWLLLFQDFIIAQLQ